MSDFDYIKNNIDKLRTEIDLINKNVKILAVTKTHSKQAVEAAINFGLNEFGESKLQEAQAKIIDISSSHSNILWHFIGHLQSNKTNKVIENFEVIESCDRIELIEQISLQSLSMGKVTTCLLEIKVSEEDTKFGIQPDNTFAIIEKVKHLGGIKINGLMTMAPYFDESEKARPYFKKVRKLFDTIKGQNPGGNVTMEILSMGMSDDYKIAIAEGSTQVRIGTAIFGKRDNYK
ncbi:MAG: YggS family pyridoxal phosphate-dependent enzyme [bacterium]